MKRGIEKAVALIWRRADPKTGDAAKANSTNSPSPSGDMIAQVGTIPLTMTRRLGTLLLRL